MRRLPALIALMVAVVACGSDPLTGVVVTDRRSIHAVDRVLVGDGLRVEIHVDANAEPSVTVVADEGVLDRVVLSDRGGTIELASPSAGALQAEITVVIPALAGLVVDSQARVLVRGDLGRLTIDAAGAAGVDLTQAIVDTVDVDIRAASAVTMGTVASVTGFVGSGSGLRVPTRHVVGDVRFEESAFLEVADEEDTQDR